MLLLRSELLPTVSMVAKKKIISLVTVIQACTETSVHKILPKYKLINLGESVSVAGMTVIAAKGESSTLVCGDRI